MKLTKFLALMLFAVTMIKAIPSYSQTCGLIHPVQAAQSFQDCVYLPNISTLNTLSFTPLVLNDATGLIQQNPIVYVQSDFVTAIEVDSARNYSVVGFYQMTDRWVSHHDTVQLIHANYFAVQILNLLSTTTSNDSTYIIPNSGNINGSATFLWTQSSNGTYKHVSIFFDGTNYFTR